MKGGKMVPTFSKPKVRRKRHCANGCGRLIPAESMYVLCEKCLWEEK